LCMLHCMSLDLFRVSDDGPSSGVARRGGRRPKAFREGTRGKWVSALPACYGDFGAVPTDVAAADVAGGVIARRRGAGDAAWNARQRKLDADLGFAGLAG
jgi:hypothetical protein